MNKPGLKKADPFERYVGRFLHGQGLHFGYDALLRLRSQLLAVAQTGKIPLISYEAVDLQHIQGKVDAVARSKHPTKLRIVSLRQPFPRDTRATEASYAKSIFHVHKQAWRDIAKDYGVHTYEMNGRPRLWMSFDKIAQEDIDLATGKTLLLREIVEPYQKALMQTLPRPLWPRNAVRWIGNSLMCCLERLLYAASREDTTRITQLENFISLFCSAIPLGMSRDAATCVLLVG